MAHYVTERLNGSLTEWDRTHDTRVYDNINTGHTLISFAYYPQFWMPQGQRPLFEASLLQLLKMQVKHYSPLTQSCSKFVVRHADCKSTRNGSSGRWA